MRSSIAPSSSSSLRGSSGPGSSKSTAARSCDTAALISSERAGASPSQNGIEGGWPCASAPRAPRGIAACQHLDDLVEIFLLEIPIRVGPPAKREQRLFVPFLFGGGLGNDLLCEDIERLVGHAHAVELAVAHGAHHRRAFD